MFYPYIEPRVSHVHQCKQCGVIMDCDGGYCSNPGILQLSQCANCRKSVVKWVWKT